MSIECKVEKGLCRCCFNDGSFKNLGDPWLEQGEHVYYADMLQKCLNIELNPVPGPLYAVTYMICDDCILRLKDACTFKYQVAQCEERFQELYGKNVIKLAPSCDIPVKQEAPDSDDEDATLITIKIDAEDDNDDDDEGFTVQNDDDDSIYDTDQDIRELEEKETKKAKPKTTKPKPKAKPKTKPKARPRKPNAASKEQPDSKEEEEGDKEKKGDEAQRLYTTIQEADRIKYQCTLCQSVFAGRDHFSAHYKYVHLKLRPKVRACHMCPVKVPSHLRSRHMEEVHGVPRPKCEACDKKFAYPNQVIKHQKTYHMGEKMFQCPQCDLKFDSRSGLLRHATKHSDSRPYKCQYCDKGFKWKKNLGTHIMIHLDQRPHVCEICHESFVQQTSLKYHMTSKHPERS